MLHHVLRDLLKETRLLHSSHFQHISLLFSLFLDLLPFEIFLEIVLVRVGMSPCSSHLMKEKGTSFISYLNILQNHHTILDMLLHTCIHLQNIRDLSGIVPIS